MLAIEAGDYVSRCHSLASLLEVSAYPKPGNVHRTRDSEDTFFEHFLAGSIATTPAIRDLATRAYKVNDSHYGEIFLGEAILRSVQEMMKWQNGGNVNLGIILLHAPIAAAAGAKYKKSGVETELLRNKIGEIIRNSQPEDSIKIYQAIRLAMPVRVLGTVQEMDVTDVSTNEKIIEDNIAPLEVFELCSERDDICSEWVSNFEITFTEGYSYLSNLLNDGLKINEAVIKTFLYILSKHPDSLIIRKSGEKEAKRISRKAEKLLKISDKGEFFTEIWKMDEELWRSKGQLNPGTTADLVSAAIFVLLLRGWRP
jgi:triphosphoribosyl-dephospho-CoA synthase